MHEEWRPTTVRDGGYPASTDPAFMLDHLPGTWVLSLAAETGDKMHQAPAQLNISAPRRKYSLRNLCSRTIFFDVSSLEFSSPTPA